MEQFGRTPLGLYGSEYPPPNPVSSSPFIAGVNMMPPGQLRQPPPAFIGQPPPNFTAPPPTSVPLVQSGGSEQTSENLNIPILCRTPCCRQFAEVNVQGTLAKHRINSHLFFPNERTPLPHIIDSIAQRGNWFAIVVYKDYTDIYSINLHV